MAGSSLTCFGVKGAQDIGLSNHKLKSALTCTIWSQCTPVPGRHTDRWTDEHHDNSATNRSNERIARWKPLNFVVDLTENDQLVACLDVWCMTLIARSSVSWYVGFCILILSKFSWVLAFVELCALLRVFQCVCSWCHRLDVYRLVWLLFKWTSIK